MNKLLDLANIVIEKAKANESITEEFADVINCIHEYYPEVPDTSSPEYQDILTDTNELLHMKGRWSSFPVFPDSIHDVVYPIAIIKLILTKPDGYPNYFIDYWDGCISSFHDRYNILINEACRLT